MLENLFGRRRDIFACPRNFRRWAVGLTFPLGLACLGCDQPGYEASVNPASHPLVSGSDPAADPTLPDDGRVSLADALAYAEAHAPRMLIAHGELALGDAEVRAARQAQPFNPTVSLGLGQRRQAGGVGLDAEVALEQQLEIAGQRGKRREAAARFRELTRLGLDAASWEVHAEAHRAFEQALLAEDAQELAERLVAFDQELLEMAERRAELGDESPVVTEVARAQLALTRSSNTATAARVETSRLALARAIGWTEPGLVQPIGPLDTPRKTDERGQLIGRAVEQSPLLQQAQTRAEVARARSEAARREAWPSPTLGVRYAREGSTSTPGNSSPASDVWMGTLEVPIPAFARNQGPAARRRAELQVAEARSQAVSVQFEAMVGIAAARVDAAAAQVEALERDVVPAFERSLSALKRAYEVGELDFLEVGQARGQLWRARQQVLDARGDYYDAFAELERLVGPLRSEGRSPLSDAGTEDAP